MKKTLIKCALAALALMPMALQAQVSPALLPYSTSFGEGDDTDWTFTNGANGWCIGSADGQPAPALYVSADGGATRSYTNSTTTVSYASRQFSIYNAGQYAVSFDYVCYGESGYDYMAAFIVSGTPTLIADTMPGGGAAAMSSRMTVPDGWQLLGTANGSHTWDSATVYFDVDADETGTYTLVLMWVNDYSYGEEPAGIDNLSFWQLTCPAPSNLTLDSAATDALRIGWNTVGTESAWEVTVDGVSMMAYENPFLITNLEPMTSYNVSVRAVCGPADSSFAVSGTFYTLCSTVSAYPYYESFENASTRSCWSVVAADSLTTDSWQITNSSALSGTSAYYADIYGTVMKSMLVSPQLNITEPDLKLIYFSRLTITGSYQSNYAVVVSPDGGSAIADFTDTLYYGSDTSVWHRNAFDLSAYHNNTIRIAFATDFTSNGNDEYCTLYIDSVAVRTTNAPMVTLTAPERAYTGETVSLTASLVEGSQNGLQWTWSSAVAGQGLATLTNTTDSTATIEYSVGGTDSITVYVENSYGDYTATVALPVYQCDPILDFPFLETFADSASSACWISENRMGNSAYDWQVTTTSPSFEDSSFAYAYNGINARTDAWFISPVFALPDTAQFYKLRYDIYSSDRDYYQGYQVLASTTGRGSLANFTDTLLFDTTLYGTNLDVAIDISRYAGQSVSFAFRSIAASQYSYYGYQYILLDNVAVRDASRPVVSLTGDRFTGLNLAYAYHGALVEGDTAGLTYAWRSSMAAAGQATLAANGTDATLTYSANGTDTLIFSATNRFGTASDTLIVSVVSCTVTEFPYHAGFDETSDCWYAYDRDADGRSFELPESWVTGQVPPAEGSGYFMSLSYSLSAPSMAYTPDNWLISPAFTLTPGLSLSWSEGVLTSYPGEHYAVYVSTSADPEAMAATTPIFESTCSRGSYDDTWAERIADLGQFGGQTVYIAFRHFNCTDMQFLLIDNVRIAESPCDAPQVSLDNGPNAMSVSTDSRDNYEVVLLIGADTIETATLNNAATKVFNGIHPGDYTVKVRRLCAEGRTSDWAEATITIDGENGIGEAAAAAVALFPNPATSQVTVSANGAAGATAAVLDLNGRTVLRAAFGSADSLTLDVSALARGTYFVRIPGPATSATGKLIVR